MTLTRWNPVTGLAALELDRLNQIFDAAFVGEPGVSRAWVPAVDILETAGKDVVVKADLPDVKREDIKVTFENDVLTIEGERKFNPPADGESHHRVERRYGAFRRSFTVPTSVAAGRVEATFQDGVLTITLPRREEARPRQIPISG